MIQRMIFTTVVLRPRLVWGKGDTKVIPEIKRAIKEGRFKWFTPEVRSSTCHVENLCEGMILAVAKGKPGNIYFLTDGPEPVIFNDFIKKLIGPSMDLSSIGSLSSTIAWYFAIAIENIPFMGYGVDREPMINRQMVGLLTQDVIVKDDKARKELGYTSHMTIEQGIQEFVESSE
jgi:nucleoside-diphosphate-sugar epimerase